MMGLQYQALVPPRITQKSFELNPSPQEIAVGALEQLRRSKLSKAWKNVLVSIVKQETICLCIWRQVISPHDGSSMVELLQQIPIASIQYVDEDGDNTNAGSSSFSVMLYSLEEGLLTFRSLDEPAAVRDWVATIRTVSRFVQNQGNEPSGSNSATSNAGPPPTAAAKPEPELNLLSFDEITMPNTNAAKHHNGTAQQYQMQNNNQWQQQQQQFHRAQHQPQNHFQQHQQQHNNYSGYSQQHNASVSPIPTTMTANSSSPPPGWQTPPQKHAYQYKNNSGLQYPPLLPHHRQQQQQQQQQYKNAWQNNNHNGNQQSAFAHAQQRPSPFPVQEMRHQNNNNLNGRALTPPPRIPRPTTTAPAHQQQHTNHRPHHQQPHQQQPTQHYRPARSLSAPPTKSAASSRHEQIKKQVIVEWALQPPAYQQLKPLSDLLLSIQKVFPPQFTAVNNHAYFKAAENLKWTTTTTTANNNNNAVESNQDKLLRKVKFFLHPDKLPKDFNDDQAFLCKLLWDIINDAQQHQQQHK